ncbi:MAG: hypothetical protein WCW64_00715 [Phycisphaerae bacterium]|jgi:hypothetical protein
MDQQGQQVLQAMFEAHARLRQIDPNSPVLEGILIRESDETMKGELQVQKILAMGYNGEHTIGGIVRYYTQKLNEASQNDLGI